MDVIPWLEGGSDSLDRDPPSDGASAPVPPHDWPWTLGCFSPAQIGRPASATVKEEELLFYNQDQRNQVLLLFTSVLYWFEFQSKVAFC